MIGEILLKGPQVQAFAETIKQRAFILPADMKRDFERAALAFGQKEELGAGDIRRIAQQENVGLHFETFIKIAQQIPGLNA